MDRDFTSSQGDVQYRYALIDNTQNIVCIDKIEKDSVHSHVFTCPNCHEEMYAALGQVQAHHFRHNGDTCKHDRYLHTIAELLFKSEFEKCVCENIPFVLEYRSPVRCDRNCVSCRRGVCLKHKDTVTVDLVKIYKYILLEHRIDIDDHFRKPDILLWSDDGKQLWVEIWVTHETDEEKKNEGPILEIKIRTENDLEQFRQHKIIQPEDNLSNVRLSKIDFNDIYCDGVESTGFKVAECPDYKDITVIQERSIARRRCLSQPKPKQQYSPPIEEPLEWIDLGLPSGTLWANIDTSKGMPFNFALRDYRKDLPSECDAKELGKCAIDWEPSSRKIVMTGPNGNKIFFNGQERKMSCWLNDYHPQDRQFGKRFYVDCNDKIIRVNDDDITHAGVVHLVKRKG